MKLLALGMNYTPEVTGIGPYTAGLCEHFVRRGDSVTVLTAFPHYPRWRFEPAHTGKLRSVEDINGVEVRRGWVSLPRSNSAGQRVLYDTSLAVTTLLNSLTVERPDRILCVSPPLQVALAAVLLGRRWGVPVILQLQDLVPDAALATGMMGEGIALRTGRTLERMVYRGVTRIVVISDGFRSNLLAKGVPESKLVMIPNWANSDAIQPMERDGAFRGAGGFLPEDFLVLHTGNMGKKQGLESAVRAATILREVPGMKLVLVGDGLDRPRLEQAANQHQASNVQFFPLQEEDLFPSVLAAADVLLLNQRAAVVDAVIPSKLLAYMAAGRPVLAAVHPDSEAARVIRAAECGLIVPPEDPQALAGAVRQLAEDPGGCARLGANGRRYAEAHFARPAVLSRYEALFDELATRSRSPRLQPVRRAEARSRSLSWELGAKRLLDVTGSGVLLVTLSPLFAAIALATKLGDGGPVLYRWQVAGRGGRPFTGYKFRTMVVNADAMKARLLAANEMSGPVFKIQKDPRVTRVGGFLRRYSLDELPQLWSVLKGDMSLVGPRPPLQTEYEQFTEWQKQKLAVKPGITCIWQISGRNQVRDFDEWVRLDLEYIRTWSFWLDLKILLKTIPAVLTGRGAS